MKNYLKKLLLRICILVLILIIMPFILEFILSLSKSKREYMNWLKEDELINKMNSDKLQNSNWQDNPLWIHKNETIEEKKESIKRILIIGDSYIWGHGYDNANNIWWQQFRNLLRENGYNDVEVLAAGVHGYSTKQEFENIIKNQSLMELIDPDLIVIGYVTNDAEFRDNNNENFVKAFNENDLFYYNSNNNFIKIYKNLFPYTYNSLSILLSNKFKNNPNFEENFGLNYYKFVDTITSGKWLNKYENEVIKPLNDYMLNNLQIPYFFFITANDDKKIFNNIFDIFNKNGITYYLGFDEDTAYMQNIKINPVNWHPSVELCKNFSKKLFNILELNYKNILGEKTIYNPIININDWMPYSLNVKKINDNIYNFVYPMANDQDKFLHLPINENYIKLNFEEPVNIHKISIIGDNIKNINIWINKIDKNLGYNTQEFIELGNQSQDFSWNLPNDELITSINISAKIINGKKENLTLKLD